MGNPVVSTNIVVKSLLNPIFPVVIFLVFLALATGLHYGLTDQDNRQIRTNLINESKVLTNTMEREFSSLTQALQRMAFRLKNTPESDWRQDALHYLNDFGIYQAIEWVDQDYNIRWLEPLVANQNVLNYDVAFSDDRRTALERAKTTGQSDVSDIIELKQGGKALIIYAPVGTGNNNRGFIAGTLKIEGLASRLIPDRIQNSFNLSIQNGGKIRYTFDTPGAHSTRYSHTEPVALSPSDWSVTLQPSVKWVEGQRSPWPAMTFSIMLLMGLLTSLTTLLVQLILKRNQALLKTRKELTKEIRQRKTVQRDLARLESTDPLTGLANRRFFMEDLAHTLHIADRQMRQVALVMMDLDRFQMLNDTLGHQFGDELLIKVSERLNHLSSELTLVAYAGGDEFMVCQQQIDSIDDVIHLLGRLNQCFTEPFEVHGEKHHVTATMGVAIYPQSGLDADTLLRNADVALYRAKAQGRNTYQFYTEGMQEREVMRLELDKDLSKALANNEFVLYYQPQLDLDKGEIHSVEALIRWQHPVRGLLPPIDFIPLAEESGSISDIGRWVVMAACRQLACWRGTPYEHLRIAVNLSGRELNDENLVDHIRDTLAAEGVPASLLEVELTEEIFIQNIDHNLDQLSRLHQLGVHLAIDDFGVGYSSLGYLRNFPVDLLKIDRSFITDVTERRDDAVITRAVINLAHNLGIRVVAEGVETIGQLNFLKQHHCNFIQGYLISRPIPVADLEKALINGALTVDSPMNSEL